MMKKREMQLKRPPLILKATATTFLDDSFLLSLCLLLLHYSDYQMNFRDDMKLHTSEIIVWIACYEFYSKTQMCPDLY